VAQALVTGAALQVEGGTFRVTSAHWHCTDCAHEWQLVHGRGQGPPRVCPHCGSEAIIEQP
jgi:Zn finger protein HypA/HybF involved in hydrogenase expression